MPATIPPRAAVVERLARAGCVAADAEADELLAAATDPATLEAGLRRREQGEPLPWITGGVTFCGRRLHIAPGLYVPRPQSEELARRAAALLPDTGHAVDLCTGAGAVAAHLSNAVPTAMVIGTDIDHVAVRCARHNGVTALVADLDAALHAPHRVDVVTAVAPYVPTASLRLLPADVQRHEPRPALDGGHDGLHVVRRVLAAGARLLRPGGWVLVEIGGDQDRALAPALDAHGFTAVSTWSDDHGDVRGLAARAGGPERSRPPS